jgi:hypothetical protein
MLPGRPAYEKASHFYYLYCKSVAIWLLEFPLPPVTQEELNKLEPGMTRRQVQYIMGSPMIADVFHQDRWDYIYLMQPGYGKPSSDHVTLYFEGDVLQRVEGSMHPQDVGADAPASSHQVTVVVPPKERVPPGLLTRLWYWITFRTPGDV